MQQFVQEHQEVQRREIQAPEFRNQAEPSRYYHSRTGFGLGAFLGFAVHRLYGSGFGVLQAVGCDRVPGFPA